jgi:hypothetical protein
VWGKGYAELLDLVHFYDKNNTDKGKLHVDVFGDGERTFRRKFSGRSRPFVRHK